jgi:hypothetical protein
MARELGLNPKKLGGYAENSHEPWKQPLPVHIEMLYGKRFGRSAPAHVRSIEEIAADLRRKNEERRNRKAQSKLMDEDDGPKPPF